MATLWNIKSILKHKIVRFSALALIVLSLVATEVAEAKTIDSEYNYIDETRFNLFKNIYEREDYKNYIIFTEADSSTYSYTSYYLALTNSDLNIIDSLNMSAEIDKLYRYYRSNNEYLLEEVNDTEINITNSVYYTNAIDEKDYINTKLLIGLNIGIFSLFIFMIINKVIGNE